tara:strand:- start:3739 stop:4743 length:1005 start_codon:yes stop_codon:yes gene_type:complete
MGLNIKDIVPKKEIHFSDLKDKTIIVDAFNTLYQFLTTIRQYDGTPLKDKKDRITSHLSGLLYRNLALLSEGIKLVYVFDGKPPEMKSKTNESRAAAKKIAAEKYKSAKEEDDIEAMKKYSMQTVRLSDEMIEESKQLLTAMGIAVIQAPGEGEAQASFSVRHHDAFAVGSQDYDCLLFGTPRLIQNLTLSRKRKTATGTIDIYPSLIELEHVLNHLQINHEQLICLGILTGTDYNPGGVKGIGQKKALDVVRKYKTPVQIFDSFGYVEFDWQKIFELFKRPDVKENADIEFPKINEDKIKEILIEHDFSEDRIERQLEKLRNIKEKAKQKTLF